MNWRQVRGRGFIRACDLLPHQPCAETYGAGVDANAAIVNMERGGGHGYYSTQSVLIECYKHTVVTIIIYTILLHTERSGATTRMRR